MEKKRNPVLVVSVIAVALISVLLLDTWQVFRLTSSLTLNSGQYHLESISGELESTISEAEQLTMKLAIEAGELLDDREGLEAFILERKAEVLDRDVGCFNVYMAGGGWSIIPDFDMPEVYIATERDWYRGARHAQGSPYVTAPYVDAMTGDICYSVSVLLGDRDTVLALDYTMDNIQSHIMRMFESGSQYALIVTGDGVIAGCSDGTLIGRHLADVLPEYSSVFSLVKSRHTFVTARIKADILFENLFATASGFGWYLIVSENDWNLYRSSYLQLIASSAIGLLMLGILVTVYLLSVRSHRAALSKVRERDRLLSRVFAQLSGPLNTILDGGQAAEDGQEEFFLELRTAGRQIQETLREADAAVSATRAREKEKRRKNGKSQSMNARFRTKILLLMALVVVISIASNLWLSFRWGNEKLRGGVNDYDAVLSEWVGTQKSILDMFCSIISASPEILEDYDSAITYLDRITRQYPEISVSYMTNPAMEPSVYMNNGWLPPEGWHVEERQWYIDALASESGWTISAPYFDDQTGLYCVTFAERVYDSGSGAFLGCFGIDFFMDKLIDILGGSYTNTGYAFLADTDGIILNHPYGSYQMTETNATNVSEVKYGQVKADGASSLTIQDYDGTYRIVTAKRNADSKFTVYEAVSFASIYLPTFLSELAILSVLFICVMMIWRQLTALLLWQDQMNARMREAAETAIAAGKSKSRFLAQMSHEIRTPINAVLGMNEMILRKARDAVILDYASNIQIAGRTLLNLINSILDFSKIEEGKMEITPVEYDTASLINNLVTSISERAAAKHLELRVETDPNLPARLYGDDVRLSQVIANLLTNAVKYTERGHVRFSIRAGVRKDREIELKVAVEDTGIGIRQEDIPRLFESFERLDSVRNHNIEGTGLGMSIVTRLLEMMGSKLSVESVYGQGSAFSFTIRQQVRDETPIGDYSSHLAFSRASVGQETLTARDAHVLVVDDNEMNLKVAKNLMQLFDITPDLASSGPEAVERVRRKRYHIIFLDHMMPKMDGIQTLAVLKEEHLLSEDTVVIALTANAVNGAREQYLSAGFDDYLSKPIDVGRLEGQLRRYLPEELCETREKAVKAEADVATSLLSTPETKAEPEAEAGPLSALEEAGYDTKAGLQYTAGDRAFYLDLVKSFADSAGRNGADIRQDWLSRAYGDYQTRVHALKSTARQIGANALSALALEQETAAGAGDYAAVDSGAEKLLGLLEETARELRTALGLSDHGADTGDRVKTGNSTDTGAAASASISPAEAQSVLSDVAADIENFEAEQAAEKLKPLLERSCAGLSLGDAVGEILAALENFDSFTAAERLDALRDQIPGEESK